MKKFIIKCSIAIIFIFFLLVGVDYLISIGLQKSNDYRFQAWSDIMKDNVDADVLFLGNSRAAMHFDVEAFDSILGCKSYNFGKFGLPIYLTMYPFLYYRELCKDLPKYIILNIDYLSFGDGHTAVNLPEISPYILDATLRNKILQNEDWFANNMFSNMYIPFYRYYGYNDEIILGMQSLLKMSPKKTQSVRGFMPAPNDNRKADFSNVTLATNVYNRKITPWATQWIETEILQWCKDNDIQVILVHTPIYEYNTQRKHVTHISEFDSVLNYYITQYNLSYLDYSNDSLSFNAHNFSDLVHLKHHAATQFTIKLAHDLDSLGIIR